MDPLDCVDLRDKSVCSNSQSIAKGLIEYINQMQSTDALHSDGTD